jgi:hypothetical protein
LATSEAGGASTDTSTPESKYSNSKKPCGSFVVQGSSQSYRAVGCSGLAAIDEQRPSSTEQSSGPVMSLVR